jgi:transposase
MEFDRADDAERGEDGASAPLATTRDRERDLICDARRHWLADSAVRLSAEEHGVPLVLPLPRHLPDREDQPPASDAGPRAVRPGSLAPALDHRQQTVETCESGGPRGYDAGKKLKGRKRHALVDTDGRAMVLLPHPASVQDRDGAGPLLQASRRPFYSSARSSPTPAIRGRAWPKPPLSLSRFVRRKPDQVGFAVQPRRWVVERFFAWISRNRRPWKDAEATIKSATAFLYAAAVMILVRRIARRA